MSEHTLHYGDISWTMPVADKNLAAVLESNPVSLPVMEPDQAVREALRHPIGSPCLKDIVNPGEKICLLVPDVTRLWQSPAVYVHVMVEELNACGIPDSDILIVTATGTHRAHMGRRAGPSAGRGHLPPHPRHRPRLPRYGPSGARGRYQPRHAGVVQQLRHGL